MSSKAGISIANPGSSDQRMPARKCGNTRGKIIQAPPGEMGPTNLNTFLACSTASTTTTAKSVNPCKITGFSAEVLELLNDCGALTNLDIAQRLNKYPKYVLRYLYNLRGYGLIVKNNENWKWYITAPDDIIIYIIYKEERKKKEGRKIDEVSSLNKNNIDKNKRHQGKQLDLGLFIGRQDVSENERVVVELLVKHFERTGVKFRYFDDMYHFCNEAGIAAQEIPETIRRLKEEGCIYALPKDGGWKIGLMKSFIERLQHV